jgi:cAMP-dependent protein kinase regulator
MTSKKDIFALWQKRDSEQADLPDIARLTTNTSANISGITLKKVKELQSPTGMRKGNGAYNSPRKIALSAKVVDRTNAPHSNTSEHSNSRHHTSEEANAKRAEFTKKRHDFRKSKRASMTTPIKMGNVAAAPIHDLDNFVPPIFAKADADVELIEDALKHNFVFENLKHNELTKMIKAFEKMRVHNGEVIINQGDTGDYFYIIGSGKVRFQVNGKTVGSAMAGKSFGELSLLYSSARAASVIAESDPTVLFRVDQKTFRHVMQTRSKESESEKMDLLKGINFLKDFNNLDLQRLSDCMVPRYFQKDDIVVSKGEVGEAFYVLQKGMMKVTDISVGSTSYEDVTLTPGDYFGERALITSEPRAANVVGCEAGTCFLIDRGTFEKVLGNFSRVILRAQDKIKLVRQWKDIKAFFLAITS